MAIKIGSSSINNIYIGDTSVKSVYLGDNLVYSKQSDPVISIDESYNAFVFDTSKVSDSTTVTLQNYRAGDTTQWNGFTDWGDGTIDNNLSHTYSSDGIYTVYTKYTINNGNSGDSNTREMLTECIRINNNITNYSYLFYGCTNLTYVNNNNFDTSNVTSMASMFSGCIYLVSLDLSNFDTRNVTDMSSMFSSCSYLRLLNISNWNMDKVNNYTYMFLGCTNLTIDRITITNCNSSTKRKIQNALVA